MEFDHYRSNMWSDISWSA